MADTSLDSPLRDWGQVGASRQGGKDIPVGQTHVYFGGLVKPNGAGHGHAFVDERGNIKVIRDPYDPYPNGKQARARANR